LIQLSTPIQAPDVSLGSPHDCTDIKFDDVEGLPGKWGSEAYNKNRLGIFAKLLDGLTTNGKNEPKLEAVDSESTAKSLTGRLNHAIEPEGLEISGEESNSNAIFAFLGQNIETKPGLETFLKNTPEDLNSIHKYGEFVFLGENSLLREMNLKNDISGRVSGREGGERTGTEKTVTEFLDRRSMEAQLTDKAKNVLKQEVLPQSIERQPSRRFKGLEIQNQQLAKASIGSIELSAAELKAAANARFSEHQRQAGELQEGTRGRRGRFNVDFRDLRTGENRESTYADMAKGQDFLRSVNAEIEIPVNLKLSAAKLEGEGAGKPGTQSFIKSFEDALARELRGNLSTDIVRDAMIIAKNGGEGTIRLSLRPASLGDVKIHLEMTENRITGLIVVESNEALRAFGKELSVLEKAFRDSGFSEASLEMFLAQDGWNFASEEQQQERELSAPSPQMAASRYEESEIIESVQDVIISSPERTPVNLLV